MSDHHPDWETSYAFTLTVTEAATILRISRSTAYALVATGTVPSLKLGRRVIVPIRPLADMLGVAVRVAAARPAESDVPDGRTRRPPAPNR